MAERGGRTSTGNETVAAALAGLDFTQMLGIADALPMGLAYVGPDLCYRFVNKALADFLERPRKSLIGLSMAEVLGPQAMAARMGRVGPLAPGRADPSMGLP